MLGKNDGREREWRRRRNEEVMNEKRTTLLAFCESLFSSTHTFTPLYKQISSSVKETKQISNQVGYFFWSCSSVQYLISLLYGGKKENKKMGCWIQRKQHRCWECTRSGEQRRYTKQKSHARTRGEHGAVHSSTRVDRQHLHERTNREMWEGASKGRK